MSQQAPVLCISQDGVPAALSAIEAFPLIDATWDTALEALDKVQPAAVLVLDQAAPDPRLAALAERVAALAPYVPLIVVNPAASDYGPSAIPLSAPTGDVSRLAARLSAALRVRTLHASVLRRSADAAASSTVDGDPLHDANVLLLGRGASYPGLSIAFGERVGVIGAFSIEAAGKHLNGRDIDGVVIGDGFSPRVIEAFVSVLAEDARFRNLPVIATGQAAAFVAAPALPNFESAAFAPAEVAARALPLIRQHAFEARLTRTLQSLDAGGALDVRTGLLTPAAFDRNFAAAIADAHARGSDFSAALFNFEFAHDRIRHDAGRILSRLMRRMDFATLQDDGAILVVFADTDLRTAHAIARRLASVLKHTPHGAGRDHRVDPAVTLVTLLPHDTAASLRDRLCGDGARAAS